MVRVVDPLQARRGWAEAPVVVLDEDAALRCSQAGLSRRDNVLVVVRAEPPAQVWRHAVAIGAAARRVAARRRDLAGPGARRGGGGSHGGPPPRRGRGGRGRMRRSGRLRARRSTRGHGRAPRRPGAAGRLRSARRRARPRARRRAGRGPALARDRRRRWTRPRCGVACGAARAPGHRRSGGRAGAALVRPVSARAHGRRRRRGSRGRTAGRRDRGVRRAPLPHRSGDHRARRRRPDAAGRTGRRPRECRRGAGGRAIWPSTAAGCASPCGGRRRVGSPPKRSPARSTCPCSSRCDPSRGWPARSRPDVRPGGRAVRSRARPARCWRSWPGSTGATGRGAS